MKRKMMDIATLYMMSQRLVLSPPWPPQCLQTPQPPTTLEFLLKCPFPSHLYFVLCPSPLPSS